MSEPRYKINDIVLVKTKLFVKSFYTMIIEGPFEDCNNGYIVIDKYGQRYGAWESNITELSKESQNILRKILFGVQS